MKRMILSLAALCLCALGFGQGLSLERCKALALENDVYLKNAALDVKAARYQKQEVLAEYFPSVSVKAMAFHALNPFLDLGVTDILGRSDAAWNISNAWSEYAYQNGMDPHFKFLEHGYGASVSLTQPIYAGGRIVNGNRLAALGIEAAGLKLKVQQNKTSESVEQKYWQVVSLQEKAKTLSQAREMLDTLEKDALSAFSAGILTDSELLEVRLKSRELQSKNIELSGGTRLAKMDLFNAIGLEYSVVRASASEDKPYIDELVLTDGFSDLCSPDGYYIPEETLAAQTPESQLLGLQVKAATLQRKLAAGEALPQVGLGASYGYGKMIGQGSSNGALYAIVSIPLTDWGKTSRKIKRLDLDRQKALNEQGYLDAQLVLRSRQLWVNVTVAWDKLQVADECVAIASDSFDKASSQCAAGLIPLSDLLEAQTELRQKRDDRIDAAIEYKTALNSYLLQK